MASVVPPIAVIYCINVCIRPCKFMTLSLSKLRNFKKKILEKGMMIVKIVGNALLS